MEGRRSWRPPSGGRERSGREQAPPPASHRAAGSLPCFLLTAVRPSLPPTDCVSVRSLLGDWQLCPPDPTHESPSHATPNRSISGTPASLRRPPWFPAPGGSKGEDKGQRRCLLAPEGQEAHLPQGRQRGGGRTERGPLAPPCLAGEVLLTEVLFL